jgi:hypothetical protein
MKPIVANTALVAYCGLYCGACGSYLKDRCPGCHENKKATWCAVRRWCLEHGFASCADCEDFTDPQECKKFNTFFSKVIGFVLRSDRPACIAQIKVLGLAGHADDMVRRKRQTIRKGGK